MATTTIDPGVSNTTRYFTLSAPPTIPDGDWCIGWWQRHPSTGLSARNGIYTHGGIGDANSCLITSAMYGSIGDRSSEIGIFIWDGVGGNQITLGGRYMGGDNTHLDFLQIAQRRSGNIEIYQPFFEEVVSGTVGGDVCAIGAVTPVAGAVIGARSDGTFCIEDPYGEFFILIGDSLSLAEVNQLASGKSIGKVKSTQAVNLRFREINTTEPDLSGNGIDAVQVGTGWATAPEFYPDLFAGLYTRAETAAYVHPWDEPTTYLSTGYLAEQTGTIDTFAIEVNDWLGSSVARGAVYDATGNLLATADFAVADGTGKLRSALSSSIAAIAGVTNLFLLIQSDVYLNLSSAAGAVFDLSGVDLAGTLTFPSTISIPGSQDQISYQWSIWLEGVAGAAPSTTPISNDSELQWSILKLLNADSDLRWDVRKGITQDSDLRWNVLQTVQHDSDLRWSVLANIIKDSDLRWSILKLINTDSDLRWSVLQMIYRDLELRWDSDGSNATVFSDSTLQWSIIGSIAKSLTLNWNVLQTITQDADIRWAILSAVAKDFEARWDVRQALQADATIEWNIIGTASKTITLRWNIQSETAFEDISGIITVNSKTGQITALSKTPVITTI